MAYTARDADELTLEESDIVNVLRKKSHDGRLVPGQHCMTDHQELVHNIVAIANIHLTLLFFFSYLFVYLGETTAVVNMLTFCSLAFLINQKYCCVF